MKKRKFKTLLIIYTITALVALSGFSAVSAWQLKHSELMSDAVYRRSFEETAVHMGRMSELMEQCRYATGSMCTKLCADSYGEAEAALSALSTLPFSTVEMEETTAFLNTAADLLSGLCGGEDRDFSDEVREDINTISDSAGELSELIFDLRDSVNGGELTVDSRTVHLRNIQEEQKLLSDEFYSMEEDFTRPELKTYAGRFSDKTVETLGTGDDWSLSEDEARNALPDGLDFEGLGKVDITASDGTKASCFEFVTQDGSRLVKIYVDTHTAAQRLITVKCQ